MSCRSDLVATRPNLLSSVVFGSLLQYAVRGERQVSEKSRKLRDGIKRDQPNLYREAARRLAESPRAQRLREELFGEDVVLVPVPRSSPRKPGYLWPSLRICEEIQEVGLCDATEELVEREEAVQKSAFAALGERPTAADHLDSFRVNGLVTAPRLLLVDDFVTSGATLLAAASILKGSSPTTEVACFALVRSISHGEIERILDSSIGDIKLRSGGKTQRDP